MYGVYIVKCSDNTLYTGIAKDIDRRIKEHNGSTKGSKYTKSRQPVRLLYRENHPNRSIASKREYQIKQMRREEKLLLIKNASLL